MVVEGTISEADYVAAQYLHMRPRPVFAIVGLLLLALFVWVIVESRSLVVIFAIVYPMVLFAIIIPWRAKRNFRQHKALSEPISIEIRENGLHRKSQYGESLTPWPHIHHWRQGRRLLLLYPASNMFYIIPGHFFPSPDEYEAFVDSIKAQLGNPR